MMPVIIKQTASPTPATKTNFANGIGVLQIAANARNVEPTKAYVTNFVGIALLVQGLKYQNLFKKVEKR